MNWTAIAIATGGVVMSAALWGLNANIDLKLNPIREALNAIALWETQHNEACSKREAAAEGREKAQADLTTKMAVLSETAKSHMDRLSSLDNRVSSLEERRLGQTDRRTKIRE